MPSTRQDAATIRARYDGAAATYDDRFRDNWRKRLRFARIERPFLQIANGSLRVLELGCGTGRLLAQTRAPGRFGIDLSSASLALASSRGLRTVVADAHLLPFADHSFDSIIAGNATFRYLDYERAFIECARVLRRGGHLGVHQYARRTWSPRNLLAPAKPTIELHLDHLDELREPARHAGLVLQKTCLWRSVRFFPYAIAIPEWLPGRLWGHCSLVFAKGD